LKKLLILVFPFIAQYVIAQSDSAYHVVKAINGEFSSFTADNLGNLYIISKNNQLKKLNPKGDSMGVFNDVRKYGKLFSIDATNPLKTILFYRDFRTIVVLDRLMNIINTIDLRKQNIFQVRSVAPSYDNNIWIFDEQESKLKKVAEDGRVVSETADLRLVFDEAPAPVSMFDQNGFVYLYDPNKGMYIFDYYGALKNKLPLLNWTDVQVVGNTILGRKEGNLTVYETGSLQLKEAVLPAFIQSAKNVKLSPQGIYILEPGYLRLYQQN
jgi:hypothetical protein